MVTKLKEREDGIVVFELKNDDLCVRLMNLGAHILSVFAKDRDGAFADVVLGLRDLEDYRRDDDRIGAVVGRVANRIGNARFSLNGTDYCLAANDGENHLHGGIEGFDKKLFSAEMLKGTDAVRFSCDSPDGEEGYPGNLHLDVTYTLLGDTLQIAYDAVSDQDTLCNITNHAYFNLSGDSETVYGHRLMIHADRIAAVDEHCLATGDFLPVGGTPFDFRTFHEIGERIDADDAQLHRAHGYDHAYILNRQMPADPAGEKNDNAKQPSIFLYHEASGRLLSIMTDMPAVHVYSGNWLSGSRMGKHGQPYDRGDGIALETEFLPDSIHIEEDPQVILRKGEQFHSETSFRFTTVSSQTPIVM